MVEQLLLVINNLNGYNTALSRAIDLNKTAVFSVSTHFNCR